MVLILKEIVNENFNLRKQIRDLKGEMVEPEEEIKEEIEEPVEEEDVEETMQDEIFELPNLELQTPEEPEKLMDVTDVSEYVCPKCGKKFANKGLLSAHMKRCGGREDETIR